MAIGKPSTHDIIDRYHDGVLIRQMRIQFPNKNDFEGWVEGSFKRQREHTGNGIRDYMGRSENIVKLVDTYFNKSAKSFQEFKDKVFMDWNAVHALANSRVAKHPSVIEGVIVGTIKPTREAIIDAVRKCEEQERMEREKEHQVEYSSLIHLVDIEEPLEEKPVESQRKRLCNLIRGFAEDLIKIFEEEMFNSDEVT